MKLDEVFSIFGRIEWNQSSPEQLVDSIEFDSRKISKNSIFVAVKGLHSDGHDHLASALQKGAIAIVVENRERVPSTYQGAVLVVLDSRWALQELLRIFYDRPEDKLIAIGITGTNGKTSSTYLIESILNEAELPCGVMGTIDHHFKNQKWTSELTTPDTVTFYQRLNDFCRLGAKAFVMEVSSHSLKQKRVPIQFDIAVFTNFTRDHLDYHQTMEDYFECKQKLFTEHLKKQGDVFAVLNSDDPMVSQVQIHPSAVSIKFGQGAVDFKFAVESTTLQGTQLVLTEKNQTWKYQIPLVGLHNVYNAIGAIVVARCLGVPHQLCQQALKKFRGIPGRLQKVSPQKNIFVDYAHTPDALEKVLQTLRPLVSHGKLICVFGCGGDRDRGKRPEMADAALRGADVTIVTSDNPRSEDPQKIIDEIIGDKKNSFISYVDRRQALQKACELCGNNDAVLVAGKGHEDYQIIGTEKRHFSDVEEIEKILNTL